MGIRNTSSIKLRRSNPGQNFVQVKHQIPDIPHDLERLENAFVEPKGKIYSLLERDWCTWSQAGLPPKLEQQLGKNIVALMTMGNREYGDRISAFDLEYAGSLFRNKKFCRKPKLISARVDASVCVVYLTICDAREIMITYNSDEGIRLKLVADQDLNSDEKEQFARTFQQLLQGPQYFNLSIG